MSPALSDLAPKRHRHGALQMHPYFGKLDPALAGALIDAYSKPGQVVLDPFCGSGTILHEAVLRGRCAQGWDSSPLATLIACGRLLGITNAESRALQELQHEVSAYGEDRPLLAKPLPSEREQPEMPRILNVESWFAQHALAELGFLRHLLSKRLKKMPPAARMLARIAFSRIVVAASNQQGESSYTRVDKRDRPGRVVDLFARALVDVAIAATAFDRERFAAGFNADRELLERTSFDTRISWATIWAEVRQQDSRVSPRVLNGATVADLVVSSPPYLMSWDYGLYHKFRFYWLGFDLDSYEDTEIGRHLRRKRDDVARYRDDMARTFVSLDQALSPSATIAFVNAPSVVYGEMIDTNEILAECGRDAGWTLAECVPSLSIPGPHHGMYASLASRGATAPGERGKREHVLIFRRASCRSKNKQASAQPRIRPKS
ncbi:MAG: hypothetical protein H7Z14_10395 [Anaerolineae bacterium]|nr:hypothetical protein [Phycisphaerae bacterium]